MNEHFAETLELYTPDGHFNYVAYLLADNNGTSIKVAKYAGLDKIHLVENEEYGCCSLIKATYSVLERIRIENRTFAEITPTVRKEHKLMDEMALREIVINSIIHNDYSHEYTPVFEFFSNRLEITSYGGLQAGQTEDDFFNGASMPKNRELMRIFHDINLVEQLGSGMKRILSVYDRSIYVIKEHYIRITIPYAVDGIGNDMVGNVSDIADIKSDALSNDTVNDTVYLSHRQQMIVRFIEQDKTVTSEILASVFKVSVITIKRDLSLLKKKHYIEREGPDKTGHWKVIR